MYFILNQGKHRTLIRFIVFLIILLMLPWPVWAEAAGTYHLENNLAAGVMGVPALWALQGRNSTGLTGKGQVIAVADSGLDAGKQESLHQDIKERLVGVKDFSGDGWRDPNGHGTHVAGSIVGSGAKSQGAIKGIAPEAGLYFQATYNEKDKTLHIPSVYELLLDAYKAPGQPRIHVNSWGASFSDGVYDWDTYSLDKFVWEHPDMVVLKSAGNGNKTSKPYVSSPGAAKNAITVGSTEGIRNVDTTSDNPDQVAGFSSRGTLDGRIKPEVLAPGTWILSTRKSQSGPEDNYIGIYNQNYSYMSGTSMSTALTAGSLALLRQYLVQQGQAPSAARIKALLIFGTRWLKGVSANDQGFGRVNIERTLIALEKADLKNLEGQGLSTGEKATYTYTGNGKPMKAVLVYTDYPKTPGLGKDLVNDLDLKITGPDGKEIYWGNGYINGDRLNNTEEVIIEQTQKGAIYTLEVTAQNVSKGPQPFALVYGTLPSQGTLKEVKDKQLSFTDGESIKVSSQTSIRLVSSDEQKNVKPEEIPPGAECYLTYNGEGQVSHIDAVYATLTSKVQSKEGNNQLVILDGTRWSLYDEAKIYVGEHEIQWAELPLEAEVQLTINPINGKIWRIDIKELPKDSPYLASALSDQEVKTAILISKNTGKVALTAPIADGVKDKPLILAFGAGLAADLVENGRPVEMKFPGLTVEIPFTEFKRLINDQRGAQLQIKVSLWSVGEQSLPAQDAHMYLRAVGKLVDIRTTIVWPDGNQLTISNSINPIKITITSPIGSTAGLDINKLGSYRFNEMLRYWEFISTDYNPDTGQAVFSTNRLGSFAILEASRVFNDIAKHWARNDIEIMAARHVVRGLTPDTFGPNETVTRGQFTVMLVRALGLTESAGGVKFKDIPLNYWCADAVGAAVQMGLVAGYSNELFGPNDPITREQMAAMLVRAMRFNNNKPLPSGDTFLAQFTDVTSVSPWAQNSVSIIVQEGLMRGQDSGKFAPKALTTRAEAATVMVRLINYKANNK
ncbi:S8 family serine peptidase [Desulfotomaculum sp. 1211_IL3151]|uniref:S8 family serine peptidase n=1 Tax=Desulfotomaculum sp. 1211_IL3151 TaxID=3084055 RepID=UPI002FDA3B98